MNAKRILKILFGIALVVGGTTLIIGIITVLSGKSSNKEMQEMAFGILVSILGAPILIMAGINLIFNKDATLD